MQNFKFKKLVAVVSVLFLQPMVNSGSFALAKRKSPPKAYSFIVEGGKASQGECDGERKIPRLKRLKAFSKASSYMGSELQVPVMKGKSDDEMWKHFFRVKASCNAALAKTPSAVESTSVNGVKPELPPDDSADSDDDVRKTDSPDND